MDTLEAAISMMKPGCYMALVDLKDAYYTVSIDLSHQKYLKFCFEGEYFQYTCLPNGLASAPRIFTKLLKPVYSALRGAGHLSSGYIDDSYLQGDTFQECHGNVVDTTTMFTRLGFFVHPEKSVFVPSQDWHFSALILIRYIWQSRPQQQKSKNFSQVATRFSRNPTIRQVYGSWGYRHFGFHLPAGGIRPITLPAFGAWQVHSQGWFFEYYALMSTGVDRTSVVAWKCHGIKAQHLSR